jgi:hypothetical protein
MALPGALKRDTADFPSETKPALQFYTKPHWSNNQIQNLSNHEDLIKSKSANLSKPLTLLRIGKNMPGILSKYEP